MSGRNADARIVPAVHGRRSVQPDPDHEIALALWLRDTHTPQELLDLLDRFGPGRSRVDRMMRRALWRAVARRIGHGLMLDEQVGFKHLETFEIGDGVFIGAQSYIQGRHDGRCVIGSHAWIGPQSYFDARDLTIGEYVGWGPGARVIGSTHTAEPIDVPVIQTDLDIRQVRIEEWADVGAGAVILPGVVVGRGSLVGAGAVVTENVPPLAVVAGVPARVIRWRDDPSSQVERA